MPYCYEYPRPMVTADIMVFYPSAEEPEKLLLIQRKNPPFAGRWAFPGGYLEPDESLEACAARELEEETGLTKLALQQFKTVSTPGRDPRGHTITTVFTANANEDTLLEACAADDAAALRWFAIDEIPLLAFDHSEILQDFLDNGPCIRSL